MLPEEKADRIIELYRKYGDADYIGEPVSQVEHMCQCAQLAEASGADEEMVLAAFFHDIGHLYEHIAEEKTAHMDQYGTVDHETLGAAYIRKLGFGERMARLVESHVNAKRYLVAKYPEYRAKLSEASLQTLIMQGGPMDETEMIAFENDPLHKEYIQLRFWDEQAKETNLPLPDLQQYRNMIIQQLHKKSYVTY
jgi:2-amino-1-hydroxyethylphosphonate dioxygenase (glycine-forming)